MITLAKQTPERAWLAEVASVALVQACNDLHRAYRNFFDGLAGQAQGPPGRPPRFRTKRGPQAVRLTRNGFALTGPGCRGEGRRRAAALVAARCRRRPAAAPSSASPPAATTSPSSSTRPGPAAAGRPDAGIDLGLARFATLADSDGTVEVVANPRHLRAGERRLARAQRALSRKQKGRPTGRRPGAGWPAHARSTTGGPTSCTSSPRLLRENQAVYVEDLAVAGLARTRLAKSVHDAGWATFLRLLEEKAPARAPRRQGAPLGAHLPDVQRVRAWGRPQAARRARLDVPGCGTSTTATSTRPGTSSSPPGWRRHKPPVEQCQPSDPWQSAVEAGTRRGAV